MPISVTNSEKLVDTALMEQMEPDDGFELHARFAAQLRRDNTPHSDWDCGSMRDWYKPRTWKAWRRDQHRAVAV